MSQIHLKEYILLISSRLVQRHGKIQTATWYDRLVPGNKACDDNDIEASAYIHFGPFSYHRACSGGSSDYRHEMVLFIMQYGYDIDEQRNSQQ